jgi:endonuclease/exonuclease/phosphatase family metal-dependent hydrolase
MGKRAGAERTPVEPQRQNWFDPIVVNRRRAGLSFPFKVAALNLYGVDRVEEIAARLKRPPLHDAGVILLCEAGWRTRRSGGREVAADLASQLEMSFAFGPSFGFFRPGGPISAFMGSAILSREPLREVRSTAIAASQNVLRRKNRIARPVGLIASTTIDGGAITIGVVHLDRASSPQFRARQMAQFLAAMPSHGPAVIGGDFNSTTVDWTNPHAMLKVAALMVLRPRRFRDPVRYEPLFERLRDAGFKIEGVNLPLKPTFTFNRIIPPMFRPKLDWIAIRGIEAVPGSAKVVPPRSSLLQRRASDHDLIVCEVTI